MARHGRGAVTDNRVMPQPIRLASLVASPAAGFEQPFEMLVACHERVHRMLALLGRLREHLHGHGPDTQAQQAARDVMRYFDQAAPLHHQDEELHVFPPLLAYCSMRLPSGLKRMTPEPMRTFSLSPARAVTSPAL